MSPNSSTPGSAPKALSSKVLTMKFMKRAAAASPTTSTPSPSTADEPSSKRRKYNSDSPSKNKPDIDELTNQRAVTAALAAEESRREVALERLAAEAGDTKWILNSKDRNASISAAEPAIRFVQAGYANLDVPDTMSVEEDSQWEEKPVMVGRRSFGKFNKALEKQRDPTKEKYSSESDSSDNDNESEDSNNNGDDDIDPTSQLIKASRIEALERAKAERKAKKNAEKAQSIELAKQRKRKEVRLNGEIKLEGLSSLSGRQESQDTRTCFRCGGPHLKKDCPKRTFSGGDRGFSKKIRTS